MSIFDKFKKSKADDQVVSKPETTGVDVAKKKIEAPAVKSEIKPEVDKPALAKSNSPYGILIRPLITEKATNLGQNNKYVFEVSIKANKIQIAQAVEVRYGVKPVKVNIVNNLGKVVRRGRDIGKTKNWKKAVITVPKGKSIKIHEGV